MFRGSGPSPSTLPPILGISAFKKSIQDSRRDVPPEQFIPLSEWYIKECAYQNVEVGNRTREQGMLRLLHAHYVKHGGNVKRHDGDHNVDGELAYKVGDRVEVYWKRNWYPAVVTKCYRNHTWDVKYPPESDQVFCKRLPLPMLRMATTE